MDGNVIEDSLLDYKEGLGELAKHLPDVVQNYIKFTDACFEEGTLSKKTKHLIALGLGVYSNDEYCIIYHTKGAIDNGASRQEIIEAAAVTTAFGGGVSMSQTITLVQDALSSFQKHTH
ncbi:carboxymuconolactone decarboxylase family protein [Shimazuella sp. AN120528]|uniref:carboxymuconolactone decarboxylase family protein n=1 Tax=Shimazuella soli TaxID=1892854 RepID=UPI001F0EEC46|nr:carboxymuconolactone decarboxylase family protein [Shimazuella soli]MCH5585642.1 carboxymuconolactone decarboxylase family protein [Shimazuella soli]